MLSAPFVFIIAAVVAWPTLFESRTLVEAQCVPSGATVTWPVMLGDPNCTITDVSFTGTTAVLVVDVEHLAHTHTGCLIEVLITGTTFADGAVLLIVGGPPPSGSNVVISITVGNCTFTNALLVVANLTLANGSSLVITGSTVSWSSTPSASIQGYFAGLPQASLVLFGALALVNGSVFSFDTNYLTVGSSVGIVAVGLQSAGPIDVSSGSALLIDNIQATIPMGFAAVYLRNATSVREGSLLRMQNNTLSASDSLAGGGGVSGITYAGSLTVLGASLVHHSGNTITAYAYPTGSAAGIVISTVYLSQSALRISLNSVSSTNEYNAYGFFLTGVWTIANTSIVSIEENYFDGTAAGGGLYFICFQYLTLTLQSASELHVASNTMTGSGGTNIPVVNCGASITVASTATLSYVANVVEAAYSNTNFIAFPSSCGGSGGSITISAGGALVLSNNNNQYGGASALISAINGVFNNGGELLNLCNTPRTLGVSSGTNLTCGTCSIQADCWVSNTVSVSGSGCTCLCDAATASSECIPSALLGAMQLQPPLAAGVPLCNDETSSASDTATATPTAAATPSAPPSVTRSTVGTITDTVDPCIALNVVWALSQRPMRRGGLAEMVLSVQTAFVTPDYGGAPLGLVVSILLKEEGLLVPQVAALPTGCVWSSEVRVECEVALSGDQMLAGATTITLPMVLGLNATDWGDTPAAKVTAVVVNWTNAVESAWFSHPPNATVAVVGPVTVLSGGRTVAADLVVTGTHPAMNALRNGTVLTVYGRGLDLLPAVLPIGPVLCNTSVGQYNTTATAAIVWPASLQTVDWTNWANASGVVVELLAAYASQLWAEYFVSTSLTDSSAAAIAAVANATTASGAATAPTTLPL